MSQASASPASIARLPVVRVLLDEARKKKYDEGVLGVRALPQWNGPTEFVYEGTPVHVQPCVSTLAVREALLDRSPGSYLVILTDREADDLGAGVLSHLIGHRLRTPDPWEAVRQRFAATGLEAALIHSPNSRDLAIGLLQAEPPGGWPPALGGVLTRDHAFTSLARHHLHWPETCDFLGLLTWSADIGVTARLADLRASVGAALTEALLDWMASFGSAVKEPVRHLLSSGAISDAIPLGLVAGLLADAREHASGQDAGVAREALARLEARIGASRPTSVALGTWSAEVALATEALEQATVTTLLSRADDALRQAGAEGLAARSSILPTGLSARLSRVAEAARAVLISPHAAALGEVEACWADVQLHRLASGDRRTARLEAAVRLARWLSTPPAELGGGARLGPHVSRYRDDEAWVDAAANSIASGIGDHDADVAFEAVLAAVRERRRVSDLAFAAALAAHTRRDPSRSSAEGAAAALVEDTLAEVVIPLARTIPTLLLVIDGMSVAVATEVLADVTAARRVWTEAVLPGHPGRASVLAVLPTLTEVSRTSLLCGRLARGTQADERRGYDELMTAHGVVGAALFHKKPLDSSRPGFAVADDVATAIADTSGRSLVTCVLNAVDDALDRSDPSGTAWGGETVKHLDPLLLQAERAGRVVVLVSDHGHIIERRQGRQRSYPAISSGRSRAATPPAAEGEVLVEGRRVLSGDGRAVLAVDERIRFGPLKAGYHGGASPAEAVIPLAVLVPGSVPDGTALRLAPPQGPSWWLGPLIAAPDAVQEPDSLPAPTSEGALFDLPAPTPLAGSAPAVLSAGAELARRVVTSPLWKEQRAAAPRVTLSDDAVVALLSALLTAPNRRLGPVAAATALSLPEASVRGSIRHAQQLLNVEGYVVLGIDDDGATTILDEPLLREQFELDR